MVFTCPNDGWTGLCIKQWAEIIRNCIRHRPEAESNQSWRSALTVCWITAVLYKFYHFFVFIHNIWKKRLVLFGARND